MTQRGHQKICQSDEATVEQRDKQYVLMMDFYGKIVILTADTLEEVSTRKVPMIGSCQIAVCNNVFYVIDMESGQIKSTPVSSLLKREAIQWDICANFPSSWWTVGHVAVADAIIYFMDTDYLWKFDTIAKTVTQLHAFVATNYFYSIVELKGLIYGWMENSFQVCDEIKGWKPIAMPKYFGQCPYYGSLITMNDSICLVGGVNQHGVCLSGVLCYDTISKSWTKGNSINQPRQQTCPLSQDGGRSLLVGGHNGQWMETIELFDQQTKKWHLIDHKVKLSCPQVVTFDV